MLHNAGDDQCHGEHHFALITGGVQLRQLVGLGLLDLGAGGGFGLPPTMKSGTATSSPAAIRSARSRASSASSRSRS